MIHMHISISTEYVLFIQYVSGKWHLLYIYIYIYIQYKHSQYIPWT